MTNNNKNTVVGSLALLTAYLVTVRAEEEWSGSGIPSSLYWSSLFQTSNLEYLCETDWLV